MGVWDFICSTTETVKGKTPDLTPLKNACKTSYGYGSAAFWKTDDVIRVNGAQKLYQYMSDEKGRAQITLIASKIAQNSAHFALKESYKLLPGGKAVGEIVQKTMQDVKAEKRKSEDMKVVKEVTGVTSGKTSGSRNVLDCGEMQSKSVQFGCQKENSADSIVANQTPEDMLRIFMMTEFIGTRLLDDLIVPQKRHGKNQK